MFVSKAEASWMVDSDGGRSGSLAADAAAAVGGGHPTHCCQLMLVAGCEWRGSGVLSRKSLRRGGLALRRGHGALIGLSSELSSPEGEAKHGGWRWDVRGVGGNCLRVTRGGE